MAHKTEKEKKDSFFNLYFTSTISISASLFMVGLVALLLLWGKNTTNATKENLSMAVIISDSATESDITRVEKYLKSVEYVKKFTYISKDEALKEHIANSGDDPTEILGFNPLKASIEMNLNAAYINNKFLESFDKKFADYPFVEDVVYQKVMIADFNHNAQKISIILLVISVVLLIITFILINNTIRISIYSKRFIINTMKLVGAKAWFIRRPFLWRFVKNGMIASLLACIGLFGIAYYLHQLDPSLPLYDYHFFVPIATLVFAVGFMVSFMSALFGINRYIRMKSDDLYFI